MTAIIQTANQNEQLSSDTALKLERYQFLENSTSELDKKNGLEKKKRPEDMTDSLAALASAIWIKQPDDIKAQVAIKFELSTNAFSSQDLSQGFTRQNEAFSESNLNFQVGSASDIAGNAATKSSALSLDHALTNIGGFKSDEVAKPEQENVPATVNSELQVSITSTTPTGIEAGAAAFREQNNNRSGQNSDLRIAPMNSTVKQSLVPEDQSSKFDGDPSGLTETTSIPDLKAVDERSDGIYSESDYKSQKEEVLDTTWISPVIQQQFATPELTPNASPQQFNNNLRRSAEQARAQMSTPKGSVEGVKYSFNSWGGGDNSVQITGSSRSGYKAQASNGVVGSILEKHISEDDSLGLTIESTEDNKKSEDLNNQLVKKVDQNNL